LTLLEVNNLVVKFIQKDKQFTAVKKLNFSIKQGEILGLIGESGSGKSVTSQSITKLIRNASYEGSISYFYNENNSVDLLNTTTRQLEDIRKNEISYIFQEPMTALNPLLTIGYQILESSPTKDDETLEKLLKKVELNNAKHIKKCYPHELSGGQRQRIMIAMALAKQPKLLIADEPTTALDIAIQHEILTLLKKLSTQEKIGILFITHDLISLKNFATNIAVMYKGTIVEQNKGAEILNFPNHPYTKALLESRASYLKKGTVLHEISDLLHEQNDEFVYTSPSLKKLDVGKPNSDNHLTINNVGRYHTKRKLFSQVKTQVLDEITIHINQGDIVGLIGESGSGKSTLAKIIIRLWKETNGTILLKNKNIDDIPDLSKEIQFVFQDPFSSLNPKHTIGKAISEVYMVSGKCNKFEAKEKTINLLEIVGLTANDFRKYPHEFSGGQRQRICIAKALAKEPKFMVLDEAVSALDVSVQAKILNLLNRLKIQKDLTYLLISHDMNVVSYFCTKIVVLKNGKIIEAGDAETLIKNPKSSYTKRLLGSSIH